ncbi:Retrovirus-related Pol polyprotein from transposon TNT 1-94 [Dendrobium catenatum]|uniref:Retrovirus-related Pol polyprotein from transposon TNT 1-94 n=1 Tax=Dendrobium catenatum TaxID=906689 RepID=A0A2I0WB13_9ASPA|nr:Retrovirus-related Pol polyprotein from transposon TNT 1-94 [Dendrobium catenatum]
MKLEAILIQQGVEKALLPESELPSTMSDQEKLSIQKKAFSSIILCLADQVLRKVSHVKTVSELWKKLEELYRQKTLPNRIYLKEKFFGYKMDEAKSIDDNLDEFNKLILDLENLEVKIEDEDKAIILLNSLPKSLRNFKETLKYGRETITVDEVQNALSSKILDMKISEKNHSGEGLHVRGRSQKRGTSQKKWKSKSRSKSASKKDYKNVKCWQCNKTGHIRRFCPEKNPKDKSQSQGDAAIVGENYDSADVLNVSDLLLGNNKACDVVGIGSIAVKMHDGHVRILKDVRHVPDLKRNLISLGTLDDSGYIFRSERGLLRISKGALVIMKGIKRNGLYVLQGATLVGETHVTAKQNLDKTKLWHQRLGHLSDRGLIELQKQGLFGNDSIAKIDFCESCIIGKSHRLSFKLSTHRAEGILDYIHSDLWGPARVATHGGNRYFLSFIDDYSRKVWIFLLKSKDETFSKFLEWKSMVENQKNRKLKVLRTDNGLEFCNESFNKFCSDSGIVRHKTVSHTPQQNGLAERMNRTLLDRVRCLLFSSGLSKFFWGEALSTACYLVNRTPSSAINFKTPQELWKGKPPSLTHLRVFGCLAYPHQNKGKLEPRSIKCVFLGYPTGVKGYRLWDLSSPGVKTIISRDVIFNENRLYISESENKDTTISSIENSDSNKDYYEFEVEPPSNTLSFENPQQSTEPENEPEPVSENNHDYLLSRDRERRNIKPPSKYGYAELIEYALLSALEYEDSEPISYKEAVSCKDSENWVKAMQDEYDSLIKNNTWILVNKKENQKVVSCKWIYKIKEGNTKNEPNRYKARLVARGYTQKEGIDYSEIFSPVVKHTSIRILMGLVAFFDWELEQLDVKTAFLHGELDENIMMAQPEGFVLKGKENLVCLLKKSIYGLKQSPRQWYKRSPEKIGLCLHYPLGTLLQEDLPQEELQVVSLEGLVRLGGLQETEPEGDFAQKGSAGSAEGARSGNARLKETCVLCGSKISERRPN